MKLRTLLAIIFIVGVVSGIIWCWRTTPETDAAPAKLVSTTARPLIPVPRATTATSPEIVSLPAVEPTPTPAAATTAIAAPVANKTPELHKGMSYVSEPANAPELALAGLKRLLRGPNQADLPTITDFSAVKLKGPLPDYLLPIAAIENGGGLESAQATAYLYYAENNGDPFATVEVSVASGAATKVGKMSFGQNGASEKSLKNALLHLSTDNRVLAGTYEVRLLRQGSFASVWLKSETNDPDLIYAYVVNPNFNAYDVPPGTLMTVDEFLAIVRPYFLNRQQQLQRLGGRGG